MTPRNATLTAGMVARILVLHAAVRFFGLGRVRWWLSRRAAAVPALTGGEAERVEQARARLRLIKRRVPPLLAGNCLSQSLALWWVLARDGVTTSLCIGARRRGGAFGAHAWVEHNGTPLNAGGRIRNKFATFDSDFSLTSDG